MKADQLHYTSCRKGASGAAGFQIRASSSGLGETEQREIERLCGYDRPTHLPAQPTEEELKTDFPVLYRFGRLDNGRWFIIRACYVGLDYSNRPGNFFAHALIGPTGPMKCNPIAYFNWSGWKSRLSPEEDTDAKPLPLPQIELELIPTEEGFRWSDLSTFLSGGAHREAWLAKSLRAVIQGKWNREQPVVLQDCIENNPVWIACLLHSFPLSYLQEVSFSTYQTSTRGVPALSATTKGTQFDSIPSEDPRFTICRIQDRAPDPQTVGKYAEMVSRYLSRDELTTSGDRCVDDLFQFLANFNLPQIDEHLDSATWCYALMQDPSLQIPADQLSQLLAFLNQHVRPDRWSDLVPVLERLTRKPDVGTPRALGENVLTLALKATEQTQSETVRQRIIQRWMELFDNALVHGEDVRSLEALEKQIERAFDTRGRKIAEAVVDPKHIEHMLPQLLDQEPGGFSVFVNRVNKSLETLGREPVWRDDSFQRICRALLDRSLNPELVSVVFSTFQRDPQALAEVASQFNDPGGDGNRERASSLGRALANVLSTTSSDHQIKVRQALEHLGQIDLLIHEAEATIGTARQPGQAFLNYLDQTKRFCPALLTNHFPRFARLGWPRLTQSEQQKLALQWVLENQLEPFPAEDAVTYLQAANAGLPLIAQHDNPAREEQALARTAERLGTALSPDRPALRRLLRNVAEDAQSLNGQFLEQLGQVWQNLSGDVREEFLRLLVPLIFARASSGKVHGDVLLILTTSGPQAVVQKSYDQFLSKFTLSTWPSASVGPFVEFLFHVSRQGGHSSLKSFAERLRKSLTVGLSALSNSDYQTLTSSVQSYLVLLSARQEWDDFLAGTVEKKRKSVFSRVKRFLKRWSV